MQVTATEAKNRFGYLCAQAKGEPVFIEKGGRIDSVIVSIEEFQTMKSAARPKTVAQKQKEFNERYKDWIAEQNRVVEKHGVFGEEWRVW